MTDEPVLSAIEQLDLAVQRLAREAWNREGVLTGWVVMGATSSFDDQGESVWAWDYGVGPGTDLIRAVGLVEASRLLMHRNLAEGTSQ